MFLQRIANHGLQLGTMFDRAARRYPANVLILDHDLDIAPDLGRRTTVAEVAELIADTAARLWAAGVRTGTRVVVYKTDSFDITLLALAVARIGAVPVLLSPLLDGPTVVELVRRVDRPVLVTDGAKLTDELPAEVFGLAGSVLLTSGTHPQATILAALAGAPAVRPVRTSPDAPTLITHTSGTTGTPKLAVHTGRSLEARYRPQASVAALVRKRRTVAIHVSFVHSRLFTALAITMMRGFPLLVLRDEEPAHVAELFARLRPGVLEAHPNTFMRWEELAADPRRPLAGVRYFTSTFDAIHPRTVRRMLAASDSAFPVFGQLYGQSEVGPMIARAFTRYRRAGADGRCVGYPFPGMTDIRVISRDGAPVTKDSPGYIESRTDGRIVTYLGEHERWRKQADGGWWRTGDIGYLTRWGCLHLQDREVDEIPGFGSTLAAEDVLFAGMESLREVIIIPGPDGTPVPVVSTRDDEPLDLRAWRAAAAPLPAMADPVQWRFEDLPVTATTKVKRLELARRLARPRG